MTQKYRTPIELPADPSAALQAATKQYVDNMTWDGGDITAGTIAAARLPLVPNAPVTLTYGTTPTIDASLGNYRVMTMTGDSTVGNSITNPTDGQMIRLRCIASGAQRTVTFHANLKRPSHIASTLVIASGGRGDIGMVYETAFSAWTVLAAQVVV